MRKSVSVVIVNFNGGALLTECVRSVLTSTVEVEVFVSDNASTDSSLIQLRLAFGSDPRVRILENPTNLGFAKANNRALPYCKAPFILFLNPDCIIRPQTLEHMLDLFERDPKIGMAGCLIRNPDGSEQPGCRRSIPTPWRTFVQITGLDRLKIGSERFRSYLHVRMPIPDESQVIEAISGAFMLISRKALEAVGPMDEGYFMHFEDLDWCLRFRNAGWKVIFEPRVEITHVGGVCSASKPLAVEYYKHRGMERFYRKFFSHGTDLFMYLALLPGILGRFLIRLMVHVLAKMGLYKVRQPIREASKVAEELAQITPLPQGAKRVVVIGATSLIGDYLLPILVNSGYDVHAISREPPGYGAKSGLTWHHLDITRDGLEVIKDADVLIHLAPLRYLTSVIEQLKDRCPKRVIGFGSTSLFTKRDSSLEKEREFVQGLAEAEAYLDQVATEYGVRWTVFRPTLVYHLGRDKNVTTIAEFMGRFGFFPLVQGSRGKRQPVHAEDLAQATAVAIQSDAAINKAYNLCGGETLTYREMVLRIARALELKPFTLDIPLPLLQGVILMVSLFPKFHHLNTEMATRISLDMCFDSEDARKDIGFSPRPFLAAVGQEVPKSV